MTHITKKHLRTKTSGEASVTLLPDRYKKEAERILKVLDLEPVSKLPIKKVKNND
ncbi:hypothetical protein LEP1GSC108_1089 [Leptospira weilii str. UI 13098]|uniref:Uncharacterized protein n=1 Tax=Leptospira weilii str. UI 13098 TaxID=1088542 RepID=M6Q0N5_9LEPT|nr:hypothetical protein LEP1GSC108_1089 [Leptospira weilii str. UI 13098]